MHPALISPLAIAPMIDWTYTHFRVFMRLLMPDALLYTEMLTPQAVLRHPEMFLTRQACESPIALQLGGANPNELVNAAKLAEDYGYQEINLNLGCPSDRVQAGRFGACLMKEPLLVMACIEALRQAVTIPVTSKVRIGVDHDDSYAYFLNFVEKNIEAGAQKIIVHARKAWLKGLSPKQNRTIPPIQYDYVYQLKAQYPHLPIVINGDIKTQASVLEHLKRVDGVMIGRLACDNPYLLHLISHALAPNLLIKKRSELLEAYQPYFEEKHHQGVPLSLLIKPLLNLAYGLTNARIFKEALLQKPFISLEKSLDILKSIEG